MRIAVELRSDCLVALQEGDVPAITSDDAILSACARQDPQTKIVGPDYARALRPGDEPRRTASSCASSTACSRGCAARPQGAARALAAGPAGQGPERRARPRRHDRRPRSTLRAAGLRRHDRRRLLRPLRPGARPRGGAPAGPPTTRARRAVAARGRRRHPAPTTRRWGGSARTRTTSRPHLGAGLVEVAAGPAPRSRSRPSWPTRGSPRRGASARAAAGRSGAPRRRRPAAPRASAGTAARRSRSRRSCAPGTSSPSSTRSSAASRTAAWAGSTSRRTATSPTAGSCSRACSTPATRRRWRRRSPSGCSSPRSSTRTS